MNPEPDYAELIHRHIKSRLQSFPPQLIAIIFERCGFELRDGALQAKNRAPLTETSAEAYKRAIKEYLGKAAYEMTKVNFIMAGCRCADCAKGV